MGVSACGDHYVLSDVVNIEVHALSKPIIAGATQVCQGEIATLTLEQMPAGLTVHWYRNGVVLPNEGAKTLLADIAGTYTVTWRNAYCEVSADPFELRVVSLPEAGIHSMHDGPICYGTATVLTANHEADGTYTYQWSTGATTRSIEVYNPGKYTLTLTNASGCSSIHEIEVEMHPPLPHLQIPDTVICTAEREVVRITAPLGYEAYHWNDGSSNPYLDITAPGTYILHVEDANGCTATATFEVLPYCKAVIIPNTFSPNGDGINDIWAIGGLEDDAGAVVLVFNRNGQEVFRSRGYSMPWEGTYKGQLVPVGAYYYSISTSRGEQFKGSVTVLY